MTLSRRDTCRAEGTVLALGAVPSAASARSSNLRITEVELPPQIEQGGTFTAGVAVENVGNSEASTEVTYAFDGNRVLSGALSERLPIAVGSTEQFRYGDITLRMIDESVPGAIDPGEHEHSIGFPDGPQGAASVMVERGAVDPAEQQSAESSAGRQRGFFSNSGTEPEAISNPFNLTTLGFLLSIAGIAHLLFRGA